MKIKGSEELVVPNFQLSNIQMSCLYDFEQFIDQFENEIELNMQEMNAEKTDTTC